VRCLGRLVQLVGLLVLVLALILAWMFRDRWMGWLPESWRGTASEAGLVGRPGERALQSARDKVDSLNGWRADSVLLDANEAASLIGDGLEPAFRGRLDSLQVELGDGRIALAGILRTDVLPTQSLGPLESVVRPREPVVAEGPVRPLEAGKMFWEIDRLTVRGVPLPQGGIRAMIENTVGRRQLGLPILLPEGVVGLAVTPDRVVLYGAPR